MKDKSSNQFNPLQKLTPELMDGYVNGTLSPEVIQQVEQFLGENPFEAEAIDGLKSQNVNLSEDLAELDDRLSKSVQPERRYKAQTLQLAAAIALLAISSLVFYLLAPWEKKNEPVAVNQKVENENPQEYVEIPEGEFRVPEDNETSEIVVAEDELSVVENEIEDTFNAEPLARKPDNSANKSKVEPRVSEKVEIEISQNKVSQQQPVTFELNNSISEQDNQNPGAQPSPASAGSSLEEQEREFLSSELVPPRAQAKSATARKKSPISIEKLPTASPPSGWDNYISKEINIPDSATTNGVSGIVALTFQVDANGIPFDFRVSKSLGFGCDEEAIRLVQDGPGWNPAIIGGNPVISRGKVEIKFP